MTAISALKSWKETNKINETIGILDLGTDKSLLTLVDNKISIHSQEVAVSLKNILSCIQSEMNLKHEHSAELLFFNGRINLTSIAPKLAASIAVELSLAIRKLEAATETKIDRLMVSSLPTEYNWIGKCIPKAIGLKYFSPMDFDSLNSLNCPKDLSENSGLFGPVYLAQSDPENEQLLQPIYSKILPKKKVRPKTTAELVMSSSRTSVKKTKSTERISQQKSEPIDVNLIFKNAPQIKTNLNPFYWTSASIATGLLAFTVF